MQRLSSVPSAFLRGPPSAPSAPSLRAASPMRLRLTSPASHSTGAPLLGPSWAYVPLLGVSKLGHPFSSPGGGSQRRAASARTGSLPAHARDRRHATPLPSHRHRARRPGQLLQRHKPRRQQASQPHRQATGASPHLVHAPASRSLQLKGRTYARLRSLMRRGSSPSCREPCGSCSRSPV